MLSIDQIPQMPTEQLQAQRDIVADTDISHAYNKALSSVLDVWLRLAHMMTAGSFRCRLIIKSPSGTQGL